MTAVAGLLPHLRRHLLRHLRRPLLRHLRRHLRQRLLPAALLLPALTLAQPAPAGDCTAPGSRPLTVDGADLVLHDDRGGVRARWPLRDAQGRSGTLLAVCQLAQRRSLLVLLQGWQELWEISTDPAAPPIYDGLVHDYRMGEAIPRPGYLGVRRIVLQRPWVSAWADGRVPWMLGVEADDSSQTSAVVLHLDIRRAMARMPLGTMAALGDGPLQVSLHPDAAATAWALQLPAAGGRWQLVAGWRWQPVAPAAPSAR